MLIKALATPHALGMGGIVTLQLFMSAKYSYSITETLQGLKFQPFPFNSLPKSIFFTDCLQYVHIS